jgi:hypothetical protein
VNLFSIAKKFRKDLYCDIYSHATYFLRSNSIDLQNVVKAFLAVYEREQATYIARLYSRLKVSTLSEYLGIYLY